MSTTASRTNDKNPIAAFEQRLRVPIEKARAQAEDRLKEVGKIVVKSPVKSLAIAFVVGFGLARLLQKIT